jgi:hypothetical protein
VNKKILVISLSFVLLCVVGLALWYSSQRAPLVSVIGSKTEQTLSLGWPTEVAKKPDPRATISDFNVDLNSTVATTTSEIAATPKQVAAVSTIKPSASSFSIADSIKPPVVTTKCQFPAALSSCCDLSEINRNECIAAIAFSKKLVSLCAYITSANAQSVCKNTVTKPSTVTTDTSLVSISKPTNGGTGDVPKTNSTDATATTYTTDAHSDIDPTLYTTDGSLIGK